MKKICFYLPIFLVFGCVSIRSNVGAVPSFSKVLVVLKMNRSDDEYASRYTMAFPKKYEVCAITHDTLSLVSLKEKSAQWLNYCKSDAILTITTQNVGYYAGGYYAGHYQSREIPYEIFAEMRMVSDSKPFWKAQINTGYMLGETFEPARIIKQLKRDGVLAD